MDEHFRPIEAFASVFGISSFAGLAALLRSGKQLTWRAVASAMLNSGLLGLGIAMLWFKYYDGAQNIWFLFGVSLLAGLGGTVMVDFVLQLFKGRLADMINQRPIDQEKDK